MSADEFEAFAFLFNFRKAAAKKLFQEFDVSGDQVGKFTIYLNLLSVIMS